MLYELRRYDVAASKLPALLDRFGSFTVHKWKEYGFRLIGFWTPVVAEKSNQLLYIWGWESYEERTKKNAAWRADPERAKKWAETEKDGPLVNRVYNQLMEPTSYSQMDRGEPYGPDASTRNPYLFELREYQAMPGKITNITDRFGNFTCGAFKKHGFRQVGYWLNRMGGNDHQLTYLLAWESLDERVAKFDTFAKDPERARVFAESEKNGPIVQQVANTILRPTAFSPMIASGAPGPAPREGPGRGTVADQEECHVVTRRTSSRTCRDVVLPAPIPTQPVASDEFTPAPDRKQRRSRRASTRSSAPGWPSTRA
jgi:hypothetical protein